MQVSLSALALRLSEQQLRDNLRLMEYVHRLQARVAHDIGARSSAGPFVRPIRVASGTARIAWLIALQRVKHEQLRQRGWQLFPGTHAVSLLTPSRAYSPLGHQQRCWWPSGEYAPPGFNKTGVLPGETTGCDHPNCPPRTTLAELSWPLHDIAITNTVWRMPYKLG